MKAEDYQGQAEHQLGIRMQVLNSIILGLASYAQENYIRAIDSYTQAENTPGWLDRDGKEILYILLGNAYSRRAWQELRAEYLAPAAAYYDKALALAPDSARAIAGKGSVLYQQSLGDLSTRSVDQINSGLLDQAEQRFLHARQMAVAENNSIIAAKMGFALAQLYTVRYYKSAQICSLCLQQAQAELEAVIRSHAGGTLRVDDVAGHAHARLALILQLEGDSKSAADHYRQAIQLVGPRSQATYLLSLADVYVAAGDTAAAAQAAQDALLRAASQGDEKLIRQAEEKLATLQHS